ncbi:MAG: hypothetical protein JSR37_06645 [Verrucomicrobia bacterium]|nr:hypothetical protein [Verrucomicrobiota bacterium]MBS0636538.1 hypothetical protein [Verrucomicrobiota bacterium]
MVYVKGAGRDEKGFYIILDETPFYPQGGGQPYDTGTIDDIAVEAVRWSEDTIRHYVSVDPSLLVDKSVCCKIDEARRHQNSRCHTAGHLLGHIVEAFYPELKAVKGHHYPDGSYVEFSGSIPVDLDRINQELMRVIGLDCAVHSWAESTKKFVQIGSYNAWPCGGTHVKSLLELGQVVATKQKHSCNLVRINYNLLL